MIVLALNYSKHVQIEVLNETPRLQLNKRISFHRFGHSTIKSYHQMDHAHEGRVPKKTLATSQFSYNIWRIFQ